MKISKTSKICFGVSISLLIIIAIIVITLYFTILKPKEPVAVTRSVTVERFNGLWPELFLNVTLGIRVSIDNTKNYGGFMYKESKANIIYRGRVIGEAPTAADMIPARGKHDVNASITIFADQLFKNETFIVEFFSGVVSFSSSLTLHGKVVVFKVFKKKASSLNTCEISLFLVPQRARSVCKTMLSF